DFRSILGSPIIADETVFISSADGHLYALDLTTGNEIWSHDFGVPTLATPCPTGDSLITAAMDGSLVCFRARRGLPVGPPHAH
ncbi:PQQ-binding-like beta-propeller repeat protein, partial [Candidatus Sumerlaeota bacterium]|nr:PQQ-binding-like beta-propeller repeat protein [Candidatus Sumerlaeota bacterium]